jgi:hypothetical protein
MGRKATLVALLWLLLAALPACAGAASLQQIGQAGTFDRAIFVSSDPGNPERLLIAERGGRIVQFENGASKTLADLEGLVACCEGEQGLLSAVPAPDFDFTGRIYVDYVAAAANEIHVAEFVLPEPGHALTLHDLLVIPHPNQKNHYGGQLQFGPDGDLFISTGDGGGANDAEHNAQNPGSLLGKILRVKPSPAAPEHYEVPTDNPFFNGAAKAESRIWNLGLRNPFRFSFDRLSGAMTIADVGQDAREEIDHAPAPLRGRGANYGWNCREGLIAGPASDPECAAVEPAKLLNPVFDYPHEDPGGGRAHGCAVIGGYVSRDPRVPELYGRYVYGDHCNSEIRSIDPTRPNPAATDRSEGIGVPTAIESFGEDSAGRLYAVGAEGVYRLLGPQAPAPSRIQPRVGIKTLGKRVKRGGRATIIAFVSPCVRNQASSTVVTLLRGRRQLGRRHLNRVCTTSFRPHISRRTGFRARLLENNAYLGAESRRLTIRPRHR